MLALHEYNECWLYHSLAEQEVEPRIGQIWHMCLSMELEHFQLASEMLRKHQGKDAEDLCPSQLPQPMVLRSNIDYVRKCLATQVTLTANGPEIVPVGKLPADSKYHWYQQAANDAFAPSQNIIQRHINRMGEDFRIELKGPHPVESFRDRKSVAMSDGCILEGKEVFDRSGNGIGKVKEVGYDSFLLDRRFAKDLDVPVNVIRRVAKEIQLEIDEKQLEKVG